MIIDDRAEVIENKEIGNLIFLLTLKSDRISNIYLPGQFVMIGIKGAYDPLLRRPFSIAFSHEKGTFSIIYRVVGKGTRILSEIGKGKSVSVLGPLGRGFKFQEEIGYVLLVSGGLGIAPLLSLSQELNKRARPFLFLSGYRTGEEIISVQDVVPFKISPKISTEDGTSGIKGLVTDLLDLTLKELITTNKYLMIYSCGPVVMLKKVHEIGMSNGVPCQVSIESHMACGIGACQGCVMPSISDKRPYLRVCKDGPVFSSSEIDWMSLERSGS